MTFAPDTKRATTERPKVLPGVGAGLLNWRPWRYSNPHSPDYKSGAVWPLARTSGSASGPPNRFLSFTGTEWQ